MGKHETPPPTKKKKKPFETRLIKSESKLNKAKRVR